MHRVLITILSGLMLLVAQIWRAWPDEVAHLIFCDVGQGDAILITAGFTQILVDGGRGEQVLECLAEHVPFWDRQLELVVATHADADHIGGLSAVMRQFEVKSLLMTPYGKETAALDELKNEIVPAIGKGLVLKTPFLGQEIRFSQGEVGSKWRQSSPLPTIKLITLSPQESGVEKRVEKSANPETILSAVNEFFSRPLPKSQSYNDLSIVLFLELGQTKALLMADMEQKGEIALIQAGLIPAANILKVGHHGAKTSSSLDFLRAVRPEISLISVGQNNQYGHPSPEVVDRLIQLGSKILRTDEGGTIEIETDGVRYWVGGNNK